MRPRASRGSAMTVALPLLLATLLPAAVSAYDPEPEVPHIIIPAPEPFSLSAYDALHAKALLYRDGFVQLSGRERDLETIGVDEVRTIRVDRIDGMPPGHRNRYDLRLNGEPIDWNHTYVEYDGRMVSLRLLFTYRNQYPPDDLRYLQQAP